MADDFLCPRCGKKTKKWKCRGCKVTFDTMWKREKRKEIKFVLPKVGEVYPECLPKDRRKKYLKKK